MSSEQTANKKHEKTDSSNNSTPWNTYEANAKKEAQKFVEDILRTGKFDKDKMEKLNSTQMAEVLKQLKEIGADQGSKPLDIASYYKEGDEKYQLKWPSNSPIENSFKNLDRKTQFFFLFEQWSRRELEGMEMLNEGKLDDAEKIFDECLQRAEQLDVGELKARSYEGMMRIAQKKGDRQAELNWLEKAGAARKL